MRIGVFDSGIGGLTVLKEIIEKYPNNEYIYYGDTLNLPYGEKTKQELLIISNKIIDFLAKEKVDIIVIACGTISANVYELLKDNKYEIPIYDIITPTINYIIKNNITNVGIIATTMTIRSNVFSKNLDSKNVNNYSVDCPMFVNIIENKLNNDIKEKYVKDYLSYFNDKNIQALVLGCTHYPLLISNIKNYLGENVEYIDMGKAIANILNITNVSKYKLNLYFSKITDNLLINIETIINKYDYNIENKIL
ncbi:MAG TPA: glutamate racemase [Tenericutes bacterium]|nr:glutamate racemase [Mycoplasmatota bacterium]